MLLLLTFDDVVISGKKINTNTKNKNQLYPKILETVPDRPQYISKRYLVANQNYERSKRTLYLSTDSRPG